MPQAFLVLLICILSFQNKLSFNLRLNVNELWLMKCIPLVAAHKLNTASFIWLIDSRTSDPRFGSITETTLFWKSGFTFCRIFQISLELSLGLSLWIRFVPTCIIMFSAFDSLLLILKRSTWRQFSFTFASLWEKLVASCLFCLIIWCRTINLATLSPKFTNLKLCSTRFLLLLFFVFFYLISVFTAFLLL